METNDQADPLLDDAQIGPSDVWAKMQKFAADVEEYEATFDDLRALILILLGDLTAIAEIANQIGYSPHLRRMFVRTSYSNCEGFIWVMKQMAFRSKAEYDPPLTDTERSLLDDKMPRLRDSGEIQDEKAKITLSQNIMFMANILSRTKDCNKLELKPRTEGWNNFFVGVKVRDRLTHPKHASEMEVTDDEMKAVGAGVSWLTTSMQSFLALRSEAVRIRRDADTTLLVAVAREHGVSDEQITEFVHRIDPKYLQRRQGV